MPRTARISPAGTVFHVLNRGVGRMQLFGKDRDYEAFEAMIEKTLQSRPMRICALRLMPNHWHFVLWPSAKASWAIHAEVGRDSRSQLARASSAGGLRTRLPGRYKSFPVETEDYFYRVVRDVERNALRASLVRRVGDWRWGQPLALRVWRAGEDGLAERLACAAASRLAVVG